MGNACRIDCRPQSEVQMGPDKLEVVNSFCYMGDMLSAGTGSYCKFRNFRENFIFANSIKRHICDLRNSRLGHDIPISVNDRVILPFREGFNFTKPHMPSFVKIKPSRKFTNLQYFHFSHPTTSLTRPVAIYTALA